MAPETSSPPTDFDFIIGDWRVFHRRLDSRLTGCTEWTEFTGTSSMRRILEGFGNHGTIHVASQSARPPALGAGLFRRRRPHLGDQLDHGLQARRIMKLLAVLLSMSSMPAPALPDEVATYVEQRELCEHFRGEPFEGSGPAQLERREFLRQSIDINCAGTDRRLAALKRRYRDNEAAMALLDRYEPISEAPCQ